MGTTHSPDWPPEDDQETLDAERLQAHLDGLANPDSEMRELLQVTNLLSDASAEARPEFTSALRERLLLERAETPVRNRHTRLVVAAMGAALLLTLGTAGVAAAAQGATPGSTLYPLKTGIEDIQVGLSMGGEARARAELEIAQVRLDEFTELSKQRLPETEPLMTALTQFAELTDSGARGLIAKFQDGGNRDAIFTVRAFIDNALSSMHALARQLPAHVSEKVDEVKRSLIELADLAHQACNSCTPAASPTGAVQSNSAKD